MASAVVTEAPMLPQLADELDATIAALHCTLLELLTPERFARVQELRWATQAMAATRCVAMEALVIELECTLLETLTPEQFGLVQELQHATLALATGHWTVTRRATVASPRESSRGLVLRVGALARALIGEAVAIEATRPAVALGAA